MESRIGIKSLKLFTPGPIETKDEVRRAMLRDLGSRDNELTSITQRIRRNILNLANATDHYTCIPLQGSGTFGMEAAIGTFIGKNQKPLVIINGIYGQRITKILDKSSKQYKTFAVGFNQVPDVDHVERELQDDREITHAIFVHCETTTGIVNPINELVALFRRYKVITLIDSVSAFGSLPVNAAECEFDVLITSSNKCLESVPGISITLAKKSVLQACKENSTSFCLDLYQQWEAMERTGQWRFTPPTHVLQALDTALNLLVEETVEGRYRRYTRNKTIVLEGLKESGLELCINDRYQSPVCLAFSVRGLGKKFNFNEFYRKLKERGVLIYHAMDEETNSFRIGCIGNLTTQDFMSMTSVIIDVIEDFKLQELGRKLTGVVQ